MCSNSKETVNKYHILLVSGKILIGKNIDPRKAKQSEITAAEKSSHNKRPNHNLSAMIHRRARNNLNPKLNYIYNLFDRISASLSLHFINYKFDNSEQLFEDNDVYNKVYLTVEHKILGSKIEKDELISIQLKIKEIFNEIHALITEVNKAVVSANINSIILCHQHDSFEDNPIYFDDIGASMFVYTIFKPACKKFISALTKYTIVGAGDVELPTPHIRMDKCSSKKAMVIIGILRLYTAILYCLTGYYLDTKQKVTINVQISYMSNKDVMQTDIIEYENKLNYLINNKVPFIFEIESTQFFVCHKDQRTSQYQILFGERFIDEFNKLPPTKN